jgi:hypothetical protein
MKIEREKSVGFHFLVRLTLSVVLLANNLRTTKIYSYAIFSSAICQLPVVLSSKKYSYVLFSSAIFELLLNLKKINLCPF